MVSSLANLPNPRQLSRDRVGGAVGGGTDLEPRIEAQRERLRVAVEASGLAVDCAPAGTR